MARKLFAFLQARVRGGAVHLSFAKGTPLFTDDRGPRLPVRVCRSTEDAFTFGQDYSEYFDGLNVGDAEILYDGELDAENGRRFHYIDERVEPQRTYAYWVSSNRGDPPTGPIGVRVRHPKVWWSEDELRRRLAQLASSYPDQVQVGAAGRTTQGRDLPRIVVGDPRRCVALVGTVHPGEAGPELIVGALERLLQRDPILLATTGIVAIPSLGLDQRQRQVDGWAAYLRRNANGVDVNRNFPGRWSTVDHNYGDVTSNPASVTYRGPFPASERETGAVIDLVREFSPQAVLSFHCLASVCGPQMLTSRYAADDEAFTARCWTIARAYADGFYEGDAGGAPVLLHACSAGSLATWLYDELGLPGVDLEGDDRPESRASWEDHATPALVEEYQERHYRALRKLLSSSI